MTEVQTRKPREASSRAAVERPTSWKQPEALPSPDPREGWTHRWVRVSMIGTNDPGNISSKFREGYEPCKAEDYPEMLMLESTDGRFKGNIEIGGLLLCRIPSEFLVQREKFYSNKNKSEMEAVDNSFMKDSDPRMPLFSEKRTQVSFGPRS